MDRYDIIIIGAGPGGYVAAIRAAQLGKKVAIVEKDKLGGICLNWGCIPTKALLKSAQAYHYALNGLDYGFEADNVKIDISKVVERSRKVAEQMSRGVDFLMKKNKITIIKGNAKVAAVGELEVKDNESGNEFKVLADNIILATGSRPNSLPFAPIDEENIISYKKAMVPEELPSSMAVIGSGAIGCELAYFYHTIGVEKVYVIEYMDRILPLEDDDVSAQISRSFRKIKMKVMTSAQVKNVEVITDENNHSKCNLTIETKKGEQKIEVDKVLSAVGVLPNTESLGLENLGVKMNKGKVIVDEYYQSSVAGIYAIGDIIPTPALAHVASSEAVCCVEKIAGLNPELIDYNNIPACTFISPEVASVGLTERKVKEESYDYVVGKFPFTASGKAVSAGERDGFVKLIIDKKSDNILGAHIVGANVTETIGTLVMARKFGLKARDIINTMFPHPTMSESIKEAAEASHDEVIHL